MADDFPVVDVGDDEKHGGLKPPKQQRVAKPEPGDGRPLQQPDVIRFKWNKEMTEKKQCDTKHMLLLLQLALEAVRLRTNERNEYFKSIAREDRYISHLDAPRIMTNFIEWHNQAKESNKFDGELLDKVDKLHLINNIIGKIGGVKMGPATRIYTKLTKETVVRHSEWCALPQPTLELRTWGYTKFILAEKEIHECNTQDIVTLLTYQCHPHSDNDSKKNSDDEEQAKSITGLFQIFEEANAKKDKTNVLQNLHLIGRSKQHLMSAPHSLSETEADDLYDRDPSGYNQEIVRKWRQRHSNEPMENYWKMQIVSFVRGERNIVPDANGFEAVSFGALNGAKLTPNTKEAVNNLLAFLMPPKIVNHKGNASNVGLRGGVNQIFREFRKVYVFGILDAASQN